MNDIVLTAGGKDSLGVVRIMAKDGSLEREFKISGEEMRSRVLNQPPPGCSKEEWESGRACLMGLALDTGQCYVRRDGVLVVQYAESLKDQKEIVRHVAAFKPSQWTGAPPNVTVNPAALDAIESQPISSINHGVMKLK